MADDRQRELVKERQITADLRRSLADRTSEIDALRSRLGTDGAGAAQRSLKGSSSTSQVSLTRSEETVVREEITGLKSVCTSPVFSCADACLPRLIVQELQQENSAATQRAKVLEAENELLRSETDQLREVGIEALAACTTDFRLQELKILEDNLEQSIIHEEPETHGVPPTITPGEIKMLEISAGEQNVKHEVWCVLFCWLPNSLSAGKAELDQLRKRLADMEMKNARLTFEVHALPALYHHYALTLTHQSNKEISELETLVESKVSSSCLVYVPNPAIDMPARSIVKSGVS